MAASFVRQEGAARPPRSWAKKRRTQARPPAAAPPLRHLIALLSALLLALQLGIGTAGASQILPLNLEEMTLHAATIFSGRCVDVRVEDAPDGERRVTAITFAVSRSVKGGVRGRITIRMLGEQTEGAERGRRIEGLPIFRRGEEVVLFLYGESGSGLTSPVGFGQGKFVVGRDKEGRPMAVNAFGNRSLFRGLTPAAERQMGREASRWRGRGAIPPDELLDMAGAIGR